MQSRQKKTKNKIYIMNMSINMSVFYVLYRLFSLVESKINFWVSLVGSIGPSGRFDGTLVFFSFLFFA